MDDHVGLRSRQQSGGCRGFAWRARWCRTALADHAARRLVCVSFPSISRYVRDLCVFLSVGPVIKSGACSGHDAHCSHRCAAQSQAFANVCRHLASSVAAAASRSARRRSIGQRSRWNVGKRAGPSFTILCFGRSHRWGAKQACAAWSGAHRCCSGTMNRRFRVWGLFSKTHSSRSFKRHSLHCFMHPYTCFVVQIHAFPPKFFQFFGALVRVFHDEASELILTCSTVNSRCFPSFMVVLRLRRRDGMQTAAAPAQTRQVFSCRWQSQRKSRHYHTCDAPWRSRQRQTHFPTSNGPSNSREVTGPRAHFFEWACRTWWKSQCKKQREPVLKNQTRNNFSKTQHGLTQHACCWSSHVELI